MDVKTIFKVLLGTIAIMVISSCILELFNVNITSIRLSHMMKLAAGQSAELFSQETYKTDGYNGSANLTDIYIPSGVDDNGNSYAGEELYVTGNFYEGTTSADVWNNLYTKSDFKNFCDTYGYNWESLGIMQRALNGSTYAPVPDWNASESVIKNYTDAMAAKAFKENNYTPLNIGIPYLDTETVQKIFRWNLTQILSNCNNENIVKDASGTPYITYSGFRCYANQAQITNIQYEVFDVTTPEGKSKFFELTNINADNLGFESDVAKLQETMGINYDERSRICVAYIEYSMPVSYVGITPIKNIFEFVWNSEADGFDGSGVTRTPASWQDTTQQLSGGGQGDNTLPTSGKLIYYIVR